MLSTYGWSDFRNAFLKYTNKIKIKIIHKFNIY
jgi:hypothetical protein